MNLELTLEQKMIQKMVREFTENEVKPIAAETDRTAQYPAETIDQLFRYGIHRLRQAMRTLQDRCVSGITANKERCRSMVENSIGIITALNPYLGYETSASIAKEALETDGSVLDIVLARNLLSREKLDDILAPEHMINRK